jgi:hypothetical protein
MVLGGMLHPGIRPSRIRPGPRTQSPIISTMGAVPGAVRLIQAGRIPAARGYGVRAE